MIRLVVMCLLVLCGTGQAATYYVSTSGNDTTGDGSSSNPWRNLQQCVAVGTPLAAGDTCIVRSGTYTNETGAIPGGWKGRVMVIGSTAPVATGAQPITIRSEVPLGATIEVPNTWPGVDCNAVSCPFAGIYIAGRSYYIIEGFQFVRPGSAYYTQAATAGVSVISASSGITIRGNHFHDIGRTVCHNGINGQGGIFAQTPTDMVIEHNQFNTIGRRRNGESGCVTTIFHHDHAIYAENSTNLTIRRNICWDVNRGFCVNLKARTAGTKTAHTAIYNNTFSGGSPTLNPSGQIALTDVLDDVQIKNNIFHDPANGYVVWWASSSATTGAGVILTDNLTNSPNTEANITELYLRPASLVSATSNNMNTSPGFVDAGGQDYRLASGSQAIDNGENIGLPFSGAKPDQGVYESYGPLSASISGHTIDLVTDALFVPLQPTSGVGGWSVSCTGCGTPGVSGVSSSSGTIRLDVSGLTGGVCASGQSFTITYASGTGTVVDSAMIASTQKQTLFSFSSYAVTNNCSGSSLPGYPPDSYIYYRFDENAGTNANDESANSLDGTLTGGAGWAVGKTGSGLSLSPQSGAYLAVPYGNGVDPSGQSITFAFWVNVPSGSEGLSVSYVGAPIGSDQRMYISAIGGTYRLGIQGSNGSTVGDLPVTAGWQHLCLNMNAATDVATLYKDGIASNSAGSVKAYTSYALSGNIELGRIGGVADGVGAVFDEFILYQSSEDCAAIYAGATPPDLSAGSFTLVTHRFEGVWLLPGAVVDVRQANGAGIPCVRGGAVAVHLQIQCDNVTPCSPQSFPLYYSLDGLNFSPVTDTPTSGGVSFYGDAADPLLNRYVADGPLSGSLPHTDGATSVLSAGQAQTYSLAQNTSLTLRYILKIAPSFSGDAVWVRPHRQLLGAAINTYLTVPKITVIEPQGSGD